MKKIFILSLLVTGLPIANAAPSSDLLSDLQSVKADVESGSMTDANCKAYIANQLPKLQEERLQEYPILAARDASKAIMQTTWQIRRAVHDRLATLLTCRDDLRLVFYKLRGIEDLASLVVYPIPQKVVADFPNEMQNEPVPLVDNKFYDGYLGPSGKVETAPVTFNSGDLMLSRGDSDFSAELSSITAAPSQFDHVILLHKDAKGVVESVESYAQTSPGGVSRFALNFALKNENPRIQLYRAKDTTLAAQAAEIMYGDAVAAEKDPSKQIGYDYSISSGDLTHMTCAEVASFGYLEASKGTFVLPQEKSLPNQKLTQIYKKTGIKPDAMFAPVDLEFDTRFEMILEFRDHRLVEDMRLHDTVAQSFYKWMGDMGYEIRPTLESFALGDILLPIHKTKLWPTIEKISHKLGYDFPEVPAGAPNGFIVTLKQLDNISNILYKRVAQADQAYKKKTDWYMSHDQMMTVLETYRAQDYQACISGGNAELHRYLSPVQCLPFSAK